MSDERIQSEQDINELLKVRRAKLVELQKRARTRFR